MKFYKVLGFFFHRTARKKEILKAYRKLAMKWHPDKYEGEDDKKKAEKIFMNIAAAKEVLTNPGELSELIRLKGVKVH